MAVWLRSGFGGIVGVWLGLLLAHPLFAETLEVPGDYDTIQEAIEEAEDGDTVLVEAGDYLENIDFLGKDITVESVDGAEDTTIDGADETLGEDNGTTVTFANGTQVNVGFMLRDGSGVETNYVEAAEWFQAAANRDHPVAQNNLGLLYASGLGVPQSDKQAVHWYQKAAQQGLPNARYNLAEAYDHGRGVPQNYEEAAKWYLLAAANGEVLAHLRLASFHEAGLGVPEDLIRAYMWLDIAASTTSSKTERETAMGRRQGVAQHLTPDQISQAQALAEPIKVQLK